VLRGAVAVWLSREAALRLAIRCARDSMPPIRLAILDYLANHTGGAYTAEVRKGVNLPRTTVDRQLQGLHMLGVLDCAEHEYSLDGGRHRWHYSLAEGISPTVLAVPKRDAKLSSFVSKGA
jgi:predicted transcriptional regulator